MKQVVGMILVAMLAFAGPALASSAVSFDLTSANQEIEKPIEQWVDFNQEIWFRLGVSYLFKEKYLEAYNAFYMAINYDPLAYESYQNLAFVAFKMGDFRESAAALSVAIELEPDNAEAHHLLGIIYTIYAMYENAIVELEKAIEISPDDALIHYDLGFAREFGGYYVLAQESYKAALAINPEFIEAEHRLGVVSEKVVQNQRLLKEKGIAKNAK